MEMALHKRSASIATAIAMAIAFSTTAHATGVVRYVSTAGSNTNDCLIATPCKTLQGALDKTPANGEVRVMDSGYFGQTATVTKSVTIIGDRPGVTLSKLALTIDNAGATVTIRDLKFLGGGTVQDGIAITAAAHMTLQNVTIQSYARYGVNYSGSSTSLAILDTVIQDCGARGLHIWGNGSTSTIIARSQFIRNQAGILLNQGTTATITGSIVSNNTSNGVEVAGASVVQIDSTVMRGNGVRALYVFFSTVRLSDVSITSNTTGVFLAPDGVVESRQNNTIAGNGTNIGNGGGTFTTYAAQ